MKTFKIVKRNKANFRAIYNERGINVVITPETEHYEVGNEYQAYLKAKINKFAKREKIQTFFALQEVEANTFIHFSKEDHRVEISLPFDHKGKCKNNRFSFDFDKKVWYTSSSFYLYKALEDLEKSSVIEIDRSNEPFKQCLEFKKIELKAMERFDYFEENKQECIDSLQISKEDIQNLINEKSKDVKLTNLKGFRHFKWKTGECESFNMRIMKNEVKQAGYMSELLSFEFFAAICYMYDCKTIEELSIRV